MEEKLTSLLRIDDAARLGCGGDRCDNTQTDGRQSRPSSVSTDDDRRSRSCSLSTADDKTNRPRSPSVAANKRSRSCSLSTADDQSGRPYSWFADDKGLRLCSRSTDDRLTGYCSWPSTGTSVTADSDDVASLDRSCATITSSAAAIYVPPKPQWNDTLLIDTLKKYNISLDD